MTTTTTKTGIFGLSYDSLIFCLDCFNGVIPTIAVENQWETIRANLYAHQDFAGVMPDDLQPFLDGCTFNQICGLYFLIRHFWDATEYNIPDTETRMREVGLLP